MERQKLHLLAVVAHPHDFMHCCGTFGVHTAMGDTATIVSLMSGASTPHNEKLKLGMLAGVTTVLYIPGSGTNMGGQGVLLKTGPGDYEEILGAWQKARQVGNPVVSVCAHRRYHPGIEHALELIREVCGKTGCPVTDAHAHHADGQ